MSAASTGAVKRAAQRTALGATSQLSKHAMTGRDAIEMINLQCRWGNNEVKVVKLQQFSLKNHEIAYLLRNELANLP
jgi:hypothetical protein